MAITRQDQLKSNKRRKRRRIWVSLLIVFLMLIGSVAAYGARLAWQAKYVTDEAKTDLSRGDKSELRQEKVDPVKDNFSILFMGVDQRKNEPARSDALVLATFHHDTQEVKMVSIPRDSKVQIVDPTGQHQYGLSKITHAHAYGDANGKMGPDYTIATVENLFNVPVDYFVQVDFQAFVEIVDALGGVEMNVPVPMRTQNSKDQTGDEAIVLEPGLQNLNGEQALSLVRNRKSPGSGGDFGRGLRQMELIEAIVKKSASLSSVTKYSSMIDSLSGHFETNLSFGQLLSLRQYAGALSNIDSTQLKGADDTSTGTYYYVLDQTYLQEVKADLQTQLNMGTAQNTTSSSTDAGSSSDR